MQLAAINFELCLGHLGKSLQLFPVTQNLPLIHSAIVDLMAH
jgi:hypothetical protein